MRSIVCVSWSAPCLLLLAGCGPKIHHFDVSPMRVCAGDSVAIAHRVRGTPSLVVTRRGTAEADTTTYTLQAAKGSKRTWARKDVVTLPSTTPIALSFDTRLSATRDSIVAGEPLGPPRWNDDVVIGTIRTNFDRPVQLRRGDRSTVIPSGPTTFRDWNGLPIAGDWDLRAAFLPGESAGSAEQAPPAHLDLSIEVCR